MFLFPILLVHFLQDNVCLVVACLRPLWMFFCISGVIIFHLFDKPTVRLDFEFQLVSVLIHQSDKLVIWQMFIQASPRIFLTEAINQMGELILFPVENPSAYSTSYFFA